MATNVGPARIAEFKASVAADLYAAADIVNFQAAQAALEEISSEIKALQSAIRAGMQPELLAQTFMSHPRTYGLLCSILSIASEIELEDGTRLPDPSRPPRTEDAAASAATVLVDLGVSQILTPDTDLQKLLLIHQIGQDAANRRFRVDARMRRRIRDAVASATNELSTRTEWSFQHASSAVLPETARRLIDHVVLVDNTPRIAVASTFQAYSGGRQTREMSSLYPGLQKTLAASQIALILIADGRGMKALSERTLSILFSAVPHTMSLKEAEQGRLADAFEKLAVPPPVPSVDAAGLRQIIISALDQRSGISAADLPAEPREAQRALANYASEAEHLDLVLASDASSLTWRRGGLLQKLRNARLFLNGEAVVSAVGELLGASTSPLAPGGDLSLVIASISDDPVFLAPFGIGAHRASFSMPNVRAFAKAALSAAPESRIAVLVVAQPLAESAILELRRAQPLLPVNVIVLDIPTAIVMARSRGSPQERLRALSLEQSDLTKISPFVVRSVTPKEAFFGREEEENILISTLPTNSVALLGGRRIGKTSLMRHCFERLEAAGLKPFFADCQVVKTWANFGALARREWAADVPEDFRPDNMFDVVNQLRGGGDAHVVILLDEIDHLLSWDKAHEEDEVPEALFRACRAISQQNLAQFVFSGERTIATTMWDAASPHWNFCRPMMLRQLTVAAAGQLISYSMRSLGVRLENESNLLGACWDATDGHPELLQLVGDKMIALINQRDRSDVFVSPDDVLEVTNTYEYAEQYLETYWGQSTLQERMVSLMIVEEPRGVNQISAALERKDLEIDVPDLQTALRMLELYGIVVKTKTGYKLRAEWFKTALSYYGGIEATAKRYKEMMSAQ